jgi:hypothetical protein
MLNNPTRDREAVLKNLVVTEDNGIVNKKACTVYIPEHYVDRHLASISSDTYVVGIFGIVMGDVYATLFVNAMLKINPSFIDTEEVSGVKYTVFGFEPGTRMVETCDLVMNDTLTYYIYDEVVAKGRIPWYIRYMDTPYIFESAKYHAGIDLGNPRILEFLFSTIYRNPDDMKELYRHILKDATFEKVKSPVVVPFRSVIWNTSNTVSKLIGGYFSDSVTSALVNPTDRVERIEALLRA